MRKLHSFAAFLKIQRAEEHVIGLLILLALMLELGFIFIQSMSFGVFLVEYGPQSLPYSYILVAIFASLTAFLSIKVGERISFSRTLMLNLVFLCLITLLVWLGLRSSFFHSVAFVLPLLYQVVTNLGYLVIWQLAGRIFNFQQAKRLFPLLIAGSWLANILGGLLVQPLVKWIGPINLLLPAVAIFGLAIQCLLMITRTYVNQEPEPRHPRHRVGVASHPTGFLQNRYTLLIFAFLILWWIAFYFLDNIFADRVAAQFPDANQLTAFMGRLLSINGIVALISSTLLTSRIIGRFGIRAGLLSEAAPVTVIIGLLAISGSFNGTVTVVFVLAVLAKVVNVALGFSVSQTAYNMLYQPVPDAIRGRIRATAEGIFQPIASGLAGLSLLGLSSGLKFNYLGLSYVYLGFGAGLLIVIFLISGSYVNALTQAITKRRLGDLPGVLADPASIALLRSRLQDPHPAVALFALNQLDNLDPLSTIEILPKLIQHPAQEVRRESFARIEKIKLRSAVGEVNKQLTVETIPSVKETGLRALGAIAESGSETQLLDALKESDVHSLRGALIGLLKYHEIPNAEQALHRLLDSSSTADRVLAAQVLGEIGGTRFQLRHQSLFRDPDPTIRREALQSAAKSRQPVLHPLLIEACDFPDTSRAAAQAMIAIGGDIFEAIEGAFLQPNAPRQRLLTLSKVIGRIGGMRAHTLLRSRMDSFDSELRSQILIALSEAGYRAEDSSEILTALKFEVQAAAWVSAALTDLGDIKETALLSAALRKLIAQARDRVLLLLSFAFDAQSLLRAREALLGGSKAQLTYVLEIIETQLPSEWNRMVMPLLEKISPQEQLEHLAFLFPQTQQTSEERLLALIAESEEGKFTRWVRACAMYTSVQLRAETCRDSIRIAAAESDPLIRDTALWALGQFANESIKENQSALSTIEKVLILKTVDMFSQTPDDVLAEVANLLEEMDISETETIFNEGDPGDSMYIIVRGRVRVYTNDRLLNYLGEREVFGEMALLDPQPRLASVSATEPTQLFRLDQSPFYQLMAEHPEVTAGIIRVLTRLLRQRIHDISKLDARLKELETVSRENERLPSRRLAAA